MNLEKSAQLLAGLDSVLERLERDADVRELEEEAEALAEAEAGHQASAWGTGGGRRGNCQQIDALTTVAGYQKPC